MLLRFRLRISGANPSTKRVRLDMLQQELDRPLDKQATRAFYTHAMYNHAGMKICVPLLFMWHFGSKTEISRDPSKAGQVQWRCTSTNGRTDQPVICRPCMHARMPYLPYMHVREASKCCGLSNAHAHHDIVSYSRPARCLYARCNACMHFIRQDPLRLHMHMMPTIPRGA